MTNTIPQVFHKASKVKGVAECGQIKEPGHILKMGYKTIDCVKCLEVKQQRQIKQDKFKHLFRAAPEMLDVLKRVKMFDNSRVKGFHHDLCGCELCTVIRKAEGKNE